MLTGNNSSGRAMSGVESARSILYLRHTTLRGSVFILWENCFKCSKIKRIINEKNK